MNVRAALLAAARASRERLGVGTIDLYQIHGPISLRSHDAMAEALATAHAEGLVKAVGVSNYSAKETTRHGRRPAAARPAAGEQPGGVLAAAHHAAARRAPRLLPGARRRPAGVLAPRAGPPERQVLRLQPAAGRAHLLAHPMAEVDAVVAELRRIGEAHGGRTPGQVALAWLVAKGAVPIPGAKNRGQAEQNAGALGWGMDGEELARLDAAALYGKRGIRERMWQHG